jgi:hypothetical protein
VHVFLRPLFKLSLFLFVGKTKLSHSEWATRSNPSLGMVMIRRCAHEDYGNLGKLLYGGEPQNGGKAMGRIWCKIWIKLLMNWRELSWHNASCLLLWFALQLNKFMNSFEGYNLHSLGLQFNLTPKVLWWFQAQNCLKTPLLKASNSF